MRIWVQYPWDIGKLLSQINADGAKNTDDCPYPNPYAILTDQSDCTVSGTALPKQEIAYAGRVAFLCELPGPSMEGDASERDYLAIQGVPATDSIIYKKDGDGLGSIDLYDSLLNIYLEVLGQTLNYEKPLPPVIFWEKVLNDVRKYAVEDPAPYALIVELAREELAGCLKRIAESPKKILKRERLSERIQRVREMDVHCIMNLARRPGLTIPEKAGSRQRIQAVVREESLVTLENKVVRHYLGLVSERSGTYLEEYRDIRKAETSKRIKDVERLQGLSSLLLRESPLGRIKPLVTPCRVPNHTLLQNVHYQKIWEAYCRLIRNEELRQSLWRWQRRMWRDVARLWLAYTFESWFAAAKHIVKDKVAHRVLSTRHRNESGVFFQPDCLPGPYIIGSSEENAITVHLLDHIGWCNLMPENVRDALLADFYLILASTSRTEVVPIYVWIPEAKQTNDSRIAWERGIADSVNASMKAFQISVPGMTLRNVVLLHLVDAAVPTSMTSQDSAEISVHQIRISLCIEHWESMGTDFWNKLFYEVAP